MVWVSKKCRIFLKWHSQKIIGVYDKKQLNIHHVAQNFDKYQNNTDSRSD